MNRVEKLREYIDNILLYMQDVEERRCAYVHLYGVAQFAAMIAMKRGENSELAAMAGMLHDLYSYKTMNTECHAHHGADLARSILMELKLVTPEEVEMICSAIYHHSDKGIIDSSFDEVLKDADVLQHNLYNPYFPILEKEITRYKNLVLEFGMGSDDRLNA